MPRPKDHSAEGSQSISTEAVVYGRNKANAEWENFIREVDLLKITDKYLGHTGNSSLCAQAIKNKLLGEEG